MIYSELDCQPCADHDRATGENVDPIKINTFIHDKFLVSNARSDVQLFNEHIVCGKTDYIVAIINDVELIMSKKSYNNIKHQYETTFVKDIDFKNISDVFIVRDDIPEWGTGIYIVNDDKYNIDQNNCNLKIFEYYEPESKVISRSGDVCVVAKTEQWFIDYGNNELKNKVLNYVRTKFESPIPTVKEQIEKAVECMHERACSRNFGLGTKLPGTNDIIDSLSDSTIYMAYYTIAHIITNIEIDKITHDVWNYIFLGIGNPLNDIVENARNEFLYWYPVDIRVSGKDLISSHLTYALFNHMAIWDNDEYMPKSYYVNGHLMLNGDKMSKSTGNFLTLHQAITKYGSNATRFALACNDGIDDGNFTDANALTGISKLANEITFISDNAGVMSGKKYDNVQQYEYFEYQIKTALKNSYNAYKSALYSTIIKSFYFVISAKDEYIKKTKTIESNMMKLYCDAMYTMMYAICPTWAKEIEIIVNENGYNIEVNWFTTYENQDIVKYQFYADVMKHIKDEINRIVPKLKKEKTPSKIVIEVIKNFSSDEKEVISHFNDLQTFYSQLTDKKKMGIYKGFAKHISNNIEQYGILWLKWTNSSSLDEFEYIKNNVNTIHSGFLIEVVSIDSNYEYQFKNNPGRPKVNIQKI